MQLDYSDGAASQAATRDITATAVDPGVLTISDAATYDYGTKARGSSTDKTFTVTFSGTYATSSLSGSGLSAPYTFKGGTYPGTGGTCSSSLSSGTCTVVVTYAPTSNGTANQTLTLSYNDGVTTRTATRAITGTAVDPATLSISDGATYDFGTKARGTSTDKTFTITYGGSVTSTSMSGSGLSAPYTFKGGTYPGTGGTCSTSLSSGTCTIVVTWAPTANGTQTATLSLAYNDGAANQTATRAMTAVGADPASLSISDGATYDYGTKARGSSTDKTFTVTNSGGVSATSVSASGLSAPFTFKGGTYPGTGGTCSSTVAVGTCTMVVTYAPTANGSLSVTLQLDYSDTVNAQSTTRDITGTGADPASISISNGATYDFGTVARGSSNDKTFTITNSGGYATSSMTGSGISAPYTFKGGTYPGTGGTCTSALSPGTCTVVVTYAPTANGTANATLQIDYNDGAASQSATRALTGTAIDPGVLTISDGATYNFGTKARGTSTDKTFTVTYSGTAPVTSMSASGISAPYTFKGGTYPGTGGTCDTGLSSGTCTIVITWAPTANGTQNATLTISYYNGASTSSATRAITAVGADPASLSISDGTTYDFGTKARGSSTDKTLTVTNGGGVSATSVSASGFSAPYTFKGGAYPGTGGTCGSTVAVGTCTIIITYAPTANGNLSVTLTLDYSDTVNSQQATRDITGTGGNPAVLAISDGATFDYGTVAAGGTNDKTFTITNSGQVASASTTGSGLAAPYTFKGGSYPGTGGTCGAAVAVGTCTIVVTYAPTVNGSSSDTIVIDYSDGAATQQVTRDIAGTAADPATLSISDGTTYDYGTKARGSSTDKTFTITFSGDFAATSVTGSGLSGAYAFKGGTYPGTGGTCGSTISSGTCTVIVTFSPSSNGTLTGTMTIGYNDGATSRSATRAMTGVGADPASLTISDGSTYDYGTKATTSSTDKSFTVTNGGGVSATSMSGLGLSGAFSFKGGSYPGTGGTCSTSLSVSGTCTVVATFAPTANGSVSSNVRVNYSDGATTQQAVRPVTGTGAPAAVLSISDGATYDYGTKANGSSTDKTFTITNSGGVTATSVTGSGLADPFTFKGGTYPGTGGTCGATIAVGTCTIVVNFSPSIVSSFSDTIVIGYTDGITTQSATRDIAGAADDPAILSISNGATYDYGTKPRGSSTDKTFTVTYSGGVAATSMDGSGLSAPYSFKGGTYPGTGGTCTTSLSSGTCTIVVTYAPTANGSQNGTITLSYNDGITSRSATRAMTGVGADPASLTISDGATYDYGTKATTSSTDKTFTVTNGGGVTATSMSGLGLSGAYSFKGGTYPGTGGTCSTSLTAAGTCTVVATFAPTVTGTLNSNVRVNYNDGVTTQQAVRPVTGVGAAAASLSISDGATYDYGTKATGSSTDKTFTITNSGGVTATSVSTSGLSDPVTFKGGAYPGTDGTCGATIAVGTCTVVVTYAPTITGSTSETLTVSYNNGVSTQSATRDITATGADPASLSISNGATYDYGSKPRGSSTDKTFTVTYSGGVAATSLAASAFSSGDYAFKGGTYPGTGGTCSTSISSGTCTVVVTFSPSANGVISSTLTLTYNDGAASQSATRALTGTGVDPATLTISDATTYDFGTKATGSTTDKTFTVTLGGGVGATSMSGTGLSGAYSFKGGSYPGTGGTCSTSLSSGTCTVVVRFAPTFIGTQTSNVRVNYNNGVSTQQAVRPVTADAEDPASLLISDGATYNFGNVTNGSSADKTFTVTNSGGVTATSLSGTGFSAPYSYKGGAYPGTGGTCSTSLVVGTCTIVVTFAPTSTGTYNSTVQLSYNDGANSQTATRAITGGGVAGLFIFSLEQTTPTPAPLRLTLFDPVDPAFAYAVKIGDVDGDSQKESFVGTLFSYPVLQEYHPYIMSGATSKPIYGLPDPELFDSFGASAIGLGDIDGDGFADFAVGAPSSSIGGPQKGRVYVFSGRYGTLLYVISSGSVSHHLGLQLHPYQDYNGDGKNDLYITSDDLVLIVNPLNGQILYEGLPVH